MALQTVTREFLSYLQKSKPVRDRIKADPDKTLLYAGNFFAPVWKELETLKVRHRETSPFQLLPEVLGRLPAPNGDGTTMKAYVESLCEPPSMPWKPDGFTIWRALSGIFASNAVGRVYFYVASGVTSEDKVLAATEIWVLGRNPKVDPLTKEIVDYLKVCVQQRKYDINFGFTPV